MAATGYRSTLLRRFLAARQGAAAVEFAMVALPFFTLLFAVLELGMVFLISTSLENATDAAARRIRTGEFQAAGPTAAAFETAICNGMTWTGPNCKSRLSVDVRTFAQFQNVAIADPLTGGALDETKLQFNAGATSSIVLVRAYYRWKLATPLLNTGLQTLPNGERLISTTFVFRNEPW